MESKRKGEEGIKKGSAGERKMTRRGREGWHVTDIVG